MSVQYVIKVNSPLDVALYNAWEEWQHHKGGYKNWVKFLKSFPEVQNAKYNEDDELSYVYFENTKKLTWFLLKWPQEVAYDSD